MPDQARPTSRPPPTPPANAKPFSIAILYTLVGLAAELVLAVIVPRNGPLTIDAESFGRMFANAAIPAVLTGLIAWRATRPWSRARFFGVYLTCFAVMLGLQLVGSQRSATPDRQMIVTEMRRGYLDMANDAPDLIGLLQTRFPADFDRLIERILARFPAAAGSGKLRELVERTVTEALLDIHRQGRDLVTRAPKDALRDVITRHRALIDAAAQSDPTLCVLLAVGGPARPTATPAVSLRSLEQLYAALTAIAEARDRPVERAPVSKDDYIAVARAAKGASIDTSDWSKLQAPAIATLEPARVCTALGTFYDASLATPGPEGERILGDEVEELVKAAVTSYEGQLRPQ